jgi:starch-binding outer membrane protein, SusD/RagB family
MKKYILSIILILCLLPGCNKDKFFDLTNPPEMPWQDVSEFENAVGLGYHNMLTESYNNAAQMENYIDFTMSELCTNMGGSSNGGFPAYHRSVFKSTNDRSNDIFVHCYEAIAITNAALKFAAGDPFQNESEASRELNFTRLVGELHFLRAWTYAYLVKMYCPAYDKDGTNSAAILPLRLTVPKDMNEANSPVIGTVKEIYDLIVADLLEAKSKLPEKPMGGMSSSYDPKGRANKYIASAMLGRIYLRMGKFSEAKAEFDYVISNPEYALVPNPVDCFNKNQYNNYAGVKEVIFYQMPYEEFQGQKIPIIGLIIGKNSGYFTPPTYGGRNPGFEFCPWAAYHLSQSFVKRINWVNSSLQLTDIARRDKRFKQVYYYFKEYKNTGGVVDTVYNYQYSAETNPSMWIDKYYRSATTTYSFFPLIRLPEMYLSRAMIEFTSGDKVAAAADVNIIRKRAWDATIAGIDFESSPAFLTAASITQQIIIDEYAIELTPDGRYLDLLKAFKLPIGPGDRTDESAINAPYDGLYFPIPATEAQFQH